MNKPTKTVNADLAATEAELLAAAQALYSYGELSVEFDAEMGEFAVWTPADKSADYHNRVSVVTDYHVICDCCCRMAGDAGQQPDIDAAMVRLAQVGWQWVDSERGQQCWCPTCVAKALPANDSEAA